jgi:beta-glucosidase
MKLSRWATGSLFVVVGILSSVSYGSDAKDLPFMNADLPVQDRVNDLVSRMTLEEKVSQMQNRAAAIPRLGVTEYDWWSEGLHGVARAGIATVFPQAIGLAATWNTDLMLRVATVISDEARAKHHEYARQGDRTIYKGLTFWSPNVNIFRDPRWGRGQETYGEDPYLSARMGVAFVKGLQGNDPQYLKLVATPKHYAVHSGPEPDRHRFNALSSERDMYETYFPAFKACVTEAGAWSVMGAYNRTNGEACNASRRLLGGVLRGEWGFKGYVTSDCGAIGDIWRDHHIVATEAEAAALAVKIGCDLDCGTEYRSLLEAVRKGLITEGEIDIAVKRLFEARFKLGMFDAVERVKYAQIPFSVNDSDSNAELALEAARESMVLLKNADGVLPLKKDLKSILVVGPNADVVDVLYGNYNGSSSRPVTPLEGIKRAVAQGTKVQYMLGCDWTMARAMAPVPSSAFKPSAGRTDQNGLSAEYFLNVSLEGTPAVTGIDPAVVFDWDQSRPRPPIGHDNFSARWTGRLVPPKSGRYTLSITADDGFRLFLDGKKLFEDWTQHAPATKSSDLDLKAGREYDIRIEYYQLMGGASIRFNWAQPDENPIRDAVKAAKASDAVIFVGGISPMLEGEEMPVDAPGFKGGDRTDIGLPKVQEDMIRALSATGKPVVLVLMTGSALAVNWAQQNAPAIVLAWYPGQAGGTALADVLFGDYNPAGRLPVTFYTGTDQLPPFEDYSMTNRTYRYFMGKPLYPFGFGLSYTTFTYANLAMSEPRIKKEQCLNVSVDVTNTGAKTGDEVVQLYVKDVQGSTQRPIRSLKGFRRISLCPGQTQTVRLTLRPEDLSMVNAEGKWVVEPGRFEVLVGASSEDIRLRGGFEVAEQ